MLGLSKKNSLALRINTYAPQPAILTTVSSHIPYPHVYTQSLLFILRQIREQTRLQRLVLEIHDAAPISCRVEPLTTTPRMNSTKHALPHILIALETDIRV